jgi:thiol-disulfide isomerase/thioredoxin
MGHGLSRKKDFFFEKKKHKTSDCSWLRPLRVGEAQTGAGVGGRLATILTLSLAFALHSGCPRAAAQPARLADAAIPTRDGRVFHLADYRGRWVFIDYWATWCDACIKGLPVLNGLAADPAIQVIGLSDEKIGQQAWDAFLKTHAFRYGGAGG